MRSGSHPLALASLALCACAHAPAQYPSAQESAEQGAITTTSVSSRANGPNALPLHPKLVPEQALAGLLELIRTSRGLSDFTSQRVSQAMGVDMDSSARNPDDYSFYMPVTSEWLQGLDYSKKYRRLRFSFDPIHPGTSPDLTSVCKLEFDKFSSELRINGFTQSENRGEHGRLLSYAFERMNDGRSEMRVEIAAEGERAGNNGAETGRVCIRTIYIH